jgi:hypothetical protein
MRNEIESPGSGQASLTGMKLMPDEIAKQVPPLYATEHLPLSEKVVHAKWFTPFSSWTWYVVEYDATQRLAFAFVVGVDDEWGYVSVDELEAIRGPDGLTVERDINFQPATVAVVAKRDRLNIALD